MRFLGPDGESITYAELKIGDSIIMLGEEHPETGCIGPQSLGGTPISLYLYVDDADQSFTRATSAGARTDILVAEMFGAIDSGKLPTRSGTNGTWRPAKRTLRLKKCGNARASSLLKWLLRPDSDSCPYQSHESDEARFGLGENLSATNLISSFRACMEDFSIACACRLGQEVTVRRGGILP